MLSSEVDVARAWAESGGSWLTGERTGSPSAAGAGAAGVAEHLLRDVAGLVGEVPGLPTVAVLGERAALAGLQRDGARSCGGASRIVPTADGHLVLTLARSDDLALVPALVESPCLSGDPWLDVAAWALRSTSREAAARLHLLGLPGGAVGGAVGGSPVRVRDGGARVARERPRVLDLSSLWAGPLCAHVLGLAGADVVKVESTTRYDGARRGHAAFYDLLHAGHRSVVLDFADPADRDRLQRLAASADVVVEASRPHALARLGLDADALVTAGVTWVSITAHGRGEPQRVGFGDDVAATAGLVGPGPVFVADAVADPLTGLAAAAAALRSLRGPRAQLLDVSMAGVAAWAAAVPVPDGPPCPASRPSARRPSGTAPGPGADTGAVLHDWLGELR
ncbi:CoA transferase [Nocardioides marmoribigeumensis]|uniref:CoA transferase n=1 Tax=Nocardioides marmoribigeumensis TaxID=433649 RepID=A0ABU2BY03_9ACTN|nr:CoA transferase [Nocardioides marmoribigeumensis]MDR7363277.1 hypothetical protein [Nocardioides marmoribigeumensis]